jgi:apolipoprotein N-acyltransferase
LLLIIVSFGVYQEKFRGVTETPERNCLVSIVHPMIPQISKLTPADFMDNLQRHISLSKLDSNDTQKRLVIWPEYAVNTTISDKLLKHIGSFIESPNTLVITGIDGGDAAGNQYNSLVVLNNKGNTICQYDKKHLLPFGEFVPEILLRMGLRKVTSGMVNFSKGSRSRLLNIGNEFPRLNAAICFEIAFPGEIVESKEETIDCILNITNDAWFEESKEIFQHLQIAVFRAIEEGIPIIRSSNGGISCIIGCHGEILYALPEGAGPCDRGGKVLSCNDPDVIDYEFKCTRVSTIYSQYGNNIIIIVLLLTMLVCYLRRER